MAFNIKALILTLLAYIELGEGEEIIQFFLTSIGEHVFRENTTQD